jgi:hypothetical protein
MKNLNFPLWISAVAAGVGLLVFLLSLCWISAESDRKAGEE